MNRFTIALIFALAFNGPVNAQVSTAAEVDSILKTVQLLPATVSAYSGTGARTVPDPNGWRRGARQAGRLHGYALLVAVYALIGCHL